MGSTDNSAIMTIDLKWNRFRIHKSTLNKMGNPQYVQFLVNPEEMVNQAVLFKSQREGRPHIFLCAPA